jgi:hypothetical protein
MKSLKVFLKVIDIWLSFLLFLIVASALGQTDKKERRWVKTYENNQVQGEGPARWNHTHKVTFTWAILQGDSILAEWKFAERHSQEKFLSSEGRTVKKLWQKNIL